MIKHGHTANKTATRTFRIWTNMKTRCGNARASNYAFYGGRGIRVCERWQSFVMFLEDMGECPVGMTLDRINTDGDYYKENCRWATLVEQANNRNSSRVLEFSGIRMTMTQAAKAYNINVGTLFSRLDRGWSAEEALGIAPRQRVHWNRFAKRLEPCRSSVDRCIAIDRSAQ